MSDLKNLINREVDRKQERIRATVLTEPELKNFDFIGAQFPTWVANVDIGADQVIRDVPIKIDGPKARFYARVGSPVWLQKDAQGRYQIVGPADRVKTQAGVTEINEDTGVATSVGNQGVTSTREVYDFYKGGGVGSSFWNDGVHGYPAVTVRDADGNEIDLS